MKCPSVEEASLRDVHSGHEHKPYYSESDPQKSGPAAIVLCPILGVVNWHFLFVRFSGGVKEIYWVADILPVARTGSWNPCYNEKVLEDLCGEIRNGFG